MAAIRPKPTPCRLCGAEKALHGTTVKIGGFIIWRACCSNCKKSIREGKQK